MFPIKALEVIGPVSTTRVNKIVAEGFVALVKVRRAST
jgi:hypothetical protein